MYKKILSKSKRSIAGISAIALLMAALGMPAAAGAATSSSTISSNISSVITAFTSGPTVNVNVTPTGAGAQTIASDTVSVSTNDALGYTLQIADSDATLTMGSGGNTLAVNGGTPASPIAQTAGKWGWRVDSLSGFGAGPTSGASSAAISATTFASIPTNGSPFTLKTTASVASNDATTVWYAVSANTSQASGTYTDSVTYTATAN